MCAHKLNAKNKFFCCSPLLIIFCIINILYINRSVSALIVLWLWTKNKQNFCRCCIHFLITKLLIMSRAEFILLSRARYTNFLFRITNLFFNGLTYWHHFCCCLSSLHCSFYLLLKTKADWNFKIIGFKFDKFFSYNKKKQKKNICYYSYSSYVKFILPAHIIHD